jgi:hypothetical protein
MSSPAWSTGWSSPSRSQLAGRRCGRPAPPRPAPTARAAAGCAVRTGSSGLGPARRTCVAGTPGRCRTAGAPTARSPSGAHPTPHLPAAVDSDRAPSAKGPDSLGTMPPLAECGPRLGRDRGPARRVRSGRRQMREEGIETLLITCPTSSPAQIQQRSVSITKCGSEPDPVSRVADTAFAERPKIWTISEPGGGWTN